MRVTFVHLLHAISKSYPIVSSPTWTSSWKSQPRRVRMRVRKGRHSAIVSAFHAAHSAPLPHAGIIRRASAAFAAGAPPPGPARPTAEAAFCAAAIADFIAEVIADSIAPVKVLVKLTSNCLVAGAR